MLTTDGTTEVPEILKKLPADLQADLKAKFAGEDLHVVPTDLGVIVLRNPSKAIFARWAKQADRTIGDERFVLDCLAYPDEATARGWFDKRVALANRLTARLNVYAMGVTEEDEAKL